MSTIGFFCVLCALKFANRRTASAASAVAAVALVSFVTLNVSRTSSLLTYAHVTRSAWQAEDGRGPVEEAVALQHDLWFSTMKHLWLSTMMRLLLPKTRWTRQTFPAADFLLRSWRPREAAPAFLALTANRPGEWKYSSNVSADKIATKNGVRMALL